MTLEQNIRAVLECVFSESKEELYDVATGSILKIMCDDEDQWYSCKYTEPRGYDEVIVLVHDDSGDTPYEYVTHGWFYKDTWIVGNEPNDKVVAWKEFPTPKNVKQVKR